MPNKMVREKARTTKAAKTIAVKTMPDKGKVVPQYHFKNSALLIARELLGRYLVRRVAGKTSRYLITETEAYIGPHDRACHAAKGWTPRTMIMFGPPGRWYVYFTYGMHWMLNIVTREEGYPAAVLIRGVQGISGPARITKALKIDKALNGARAVPESGLWVEDAGIVVPAAAVRRTRRIGVSYAGREWAERPYRFVLGEDLLS